MNEDIFPARFLASLAHEPGFDHESFMEAHHPGAAITSIRVNPFKPAKVNVNEQVPWCTQGYYLDTRPSFTFDPLFHAGAYYVQEASSMFIDHIIKTIRPGQGGPWKVLDLCAAPGGKSTLLSSGLNGNDLLVANEIIKTRIPVLTDNLNRWGTSNTIVTNNDPRDFNHLNSFFDMVLIDAPCSGSGMFRKDPAAMNEWSENNVKLCHQRQERILADIYPSIKEGGHLIYSTCSYAHQENEDILDWLCAAFDLESVRIPFNNKWGIMETESPLQKAWGYRFYPGKVKGEGFFAACLIKKTSSGGLANHKNSGQQKLPAREMDLVKGYLKNPDDFYYFIVNGDWLAINQEHKESLNLLHRHLYIKKSGIRIGKPAGQVLIPDHELALSLAVNKEAVLHTPLSKEQAIQYLRRGPVSIETAGKGWSLMDYEGLALGWAKLLPDRINNYYPKEIRIMTNPF